MAIFKVSKRAESDLLEVGRYTQTEWGIDQRNKYLDEINQRFRHRQTIPPLKILAVSPMAVFIVHK